MKQKFVLFLVFVCAFMATTQAQISKGSVWLGGTISYRQDKNDYKDTAVKDSKNTSLSISPSIGFVVKDNLIVGINLYYGHDKTINNNSLGSESKNNSYGGGIFVRQYIPVISRLYLFGEASAGFTSSKGDGTTREYIGNGNYKNFKTTTKGWSTGLNVTPGLAFAITKKFQLETSLSSLFNVVYSKYKNTSDSPDASDYSNSTRDQLNAGIFADGKVQLNVGCRFLL